MVQFATIKAEINTEWAIAPGQANPTIYDKDQRWSAKYPDRLYIKLADPAPLKIISQSNGGGLTLQRNFFQIYGVYATVALALTSIKEVKRIITEKSGWYPGDGDTTPIKTRRRYIYKLPCFTREIFKKGDFA